MLVGIDNKFAYDDMGRRQALAPGHDSVLFFDVSDAARPRQIASLPLENSVVGPPTNLAVSADGHLALIASSLHSAPIEGGTGWKATPSDELFVVDLQSGKPRLVTTVHVGSQPSGLAIARSGHLALIANRDAKSITVLTIDGTTVRVVQTLLMGDTVTSVAISPDGTRALATKYGEHTVAQLAIENGRLRDLGQDLPVGTWPWNVAITPDGRLALVNNQGKNAASSGNACMVSVIDLAATPARVVQHVTVGDGPEGLAISPRGDTAVTTNLNGSYDAPKDAWYHHARGQAMPLHIVGNAVTAGSPIEVGAFPEGTAFSPNGDYVYVGNFASKTLSVLRVDPAFGLVDTHRDIALPGPPASLRLTSS